MTAPAFDTVSAARALEAAGVKGTCGVGTGAIPQLFSRCEADRVTVPHIPPLRPETAHRVLPPGLRRSAPPPASPPRLSRGNGGSPPESHADSCKYLRRRSRRGLATQVRPISPRRLVKPELLDVLIHVFVQRIDQRSRQFGLLLWTKLVELLSELRSISGHLRYSRVQSVGFQFTLRDCVIAKRLDSGTRSDAERPLEPIVMHL